MKNFLLVVFMVTSLFAMCKEDKVRNSTKRDTSITKYNAFSNLFLDSATLETFIKKQELKEEDANQMRDFYNSRNFQFAWFTEDGLDEQARAFWNLHNNYLNYSKDSSIIDKQLHKQMQMLLSEDSTIKDSRAITETELQLTHHFFNYAQYAYEGKIDPKELQWHIPRKKVNAVKLLDSLIADKGRNLEKWEPVNKAYKLLKTQLLRYYDIEKAGGWPQVILGDKKVYKEGDSAVAVQQLKERLRAVGDFTSRDTSKHFSMELASAVRRFQSRYGLKEDGVVGPQTVSALNVPVEERIEQLLINMERMKWMPKEPEGNRLVVNIPEFKLHVYEEGQKAFDIDIVVGKAANKTVVFNDQLKYVVFSPYWNVPASIVRNEILPAMQRNPNYLARNNMEQTGTRNGLPVIRQKPGGSNSLGRVKFIFPNDYNIYFHDTPAKSLFNRENRAFSHGCIRLAEPRRMAEYLLRDQPQWTSDRITEAMYSENEKWVKLEETVPVVISYFTAWVDNNGVLNFRDDIYGHDKRMADQLFVHDKPLAAK